MAWHLDPDFGLQSRLSFGRLAVPVVGAPVDPNGVYLFDPLSVAAAVVCLAIGILLPDGRAVRCGSFRWPAQP